MQLSKTRAIAAGVLICFALLAGASIRPMLMLYMKLGWRGWWTEVVEIDIINARTRKTIVLVGTPVRQRVQTNAVSAVLSASGETLVSSVWHSVYIFPLGMRVSPATRYHTALLDVKHIEDEWAHNWCDASTRVEQAKMLVQRWREADCNAGAAP